MRRILIAAAASASPVNICSKAAIGKLLYQPGVLTVATDKPVYPPWFIGNNPSNGKGYESAVAYAVAKELGFSNSQVKWVYEPFNNSYAPRAQEVRLRRQRDLGDPAAGAGRLVLGQL